MISESPAIFIPALESLGFNAKFRSESIINNIIIIIIVIIIIIISTSSRISSRIKERLQVKQNMQ